MSRLLQSLPTPEHPASAQIATSSACGSTTTAHQSNLPVMVQSSSCANPKLGLFKCGLMNIEKTHFPYLHQARFYLRLLLVLCKIDTLTFLIHYKNVLIFNRLKRYKMLRSRWKITLNSHYSLWIPHSILCLIERYLVPTSSIVINNFILNFLHTKN